MTLHASQVHGFFSVPVDHLHALRELASHFRDQDLTGTVVVSPDLGNAKSAAAFAARLRLPVAAGAKERIDDHTVRITSINFRSRTIGHRSRPPISLAMERHVSSGRLRCPALRPV